MFPFLSLLTADLAVGLWRRNRYLGVLLTGGVVAYTALYGLAFARVYQEEDSRIQAGKWLAENVPVGTRIGIEEGGFSMGRLVSDERFVKIPLEMNGLFFTRGYLSDHSSIELLRERVERLDYIAVIDVNRYRQFVAAPNLYPVVAKFYRRLWAGKLGFIPFRFFKVYPALGGLIFPDDDAEPSFLGYDHPAVLVFRRADSEEVERAWSRWVVEVEKTNCALITCCYTQQNTGMQETYLRRYRLPRPRWSGIPK